MQTCCYFTCTSLYICLHSHKARCIFGVQNVDAQVVCTELSAIIEVSHFSIWTVHTCCRSKQATLCSAFVFPFPCCPPPCFSMTDSYCASCLLRVAGHSESLTQITHVLLGNMEVKVQLIIKAVLIHLQFDRGMPFFSQ